MTGRRFGVCLDAFGGFGSWFGFIAFGFTCLGSFTGGCWWGYVVLLPQCGLFTGILAARLSGLGSFDSGFRFGQLLGCIWCLWVFAL